MKKHDLYVCGMCVALSTHFACTKLTDWTSQAFANGNATQRARISRNQQAQAAMAAHKDHTAALLLRATAIRPSIEIPAAFFTVHNSRPLGHSLHTLLVYLAQPFLNRQTTFRRLRLFLLADIQKVCEYVRFADFTRLERPSIGALKILEPELWLPKGQVKKSATWLQ